MSRKYTKLDTMFSVTAPPAIGFYKMEIYARRAPDKRGKYEVPLVATFLVEGRLKTLFPEPSLSESFYRNTAMLLSQSGSTDTEKTSLSSARTILRGIRRKSEIGDKSVSTRTSMFSLSNLSSRKFSIVPEDVDNVNENKSLENHEGYMLA